VIASAAPRSDIDPVPPAAAQSHGVPYPGLRPFRPDEEAFFFGRERQVDRMIDKLARQRFLAVVGTSGGGKSSLVNCGLRPALHRGMMAEAGSSWRVVQFRPGANPTRAFAQALAQVLFEGQDDDRAMLDSIVEANLHVSSLGVLDLYAQARLPADMNLLIVVGQFEELFRYHRQDTGGDSEASGVSPMAAAFVRLMLEARTQPRIHVVITMRSDFLGDCAQFRGLAEAINDGQYLVPRLTRDETRAAIMGPVSVVGDELDPVLVTQLLNDVGDSPDQLSILQHALNRTWAYWRHDGGAIGPVSLAHYDAVGGMGRALDLHAEKAYGELKSERLKTVCERVFRALTDRGTDIRGVRRPTTFGALCAITSATDVELMQVLAVFRKASRSFVMPPVNEAITPETMIDISHESLMRVWVRLKGWSQQEAESAQAYVRLAETALLHKQGRASLWRDAELANALRWWRLNAPNPAWAQQHRGDFGQAMSFLDLSQHAATTSFARLTAIRLWVRWRKVAGFVFVLLALFSNWLDGDATMFSGDVKTLNNLIGGSVVLLVIAWLVGEFAYRPIKRRFLLRKLQRAELSAQAPDATTRPRSRVIAKRAVLWASLLGVVMLYTLVIRSWYANSELEQRTHVAEERVSAAVGLLYAGSLTDSGTHADSADRSSQAQATQISLRSALYCAAGDCADSVPKLRRALLAFDSLRVRIDTLALLATKPPANMGWGMWRGRRLLANARSRWMDGYYVAFQDSLESQMTASLRNLDSLRARTDYTENYETLKALLLLHDARRATSRKDFLVRALLQRTLPVQGDALSTALQHQHVQRFVSLYASGEYALRDSSGLDTAVVRAARAQLRTWPDGFTAVDRAVYTALVAAAEAQVKPVWLDMVASAGALRSVGGVSGAYTREGRTLIERALTADIAPLLRNESWVMNEPGTITTADYAPQAIIDYYDAAFPWWWSKYLESITVSPAVDLREAAELMKRLTGARPALRTVLRMIDEHGVNLLAGTPGSVALASFWTASPEPGSYGDAMSSLRTALDSLQVGQGLEGEEASRVHHADAVLAAQRAGTAHEALVRRALRLDDYRDRMISRILLEPVTIVREVLKRTSPPVRPSERKAGGGRARPT